MKKNGVLIYSGEEDNKSFLMEEGLAYIDYEKWLSVGFSDISI